MPEGIKNSLLAGVLPSELLHKCCHSREGGNPGFPRPEAGGSRGASVPARQRISFNRRGRGGPQGKQNKEPVSRRDAGTQGAGERKTEDGEHLNPSRCKAATSRLFDEPSDGICRKSPRVNELGNPQITQISQIQEGGTRPAVVASLPFASWPFFRNLW
jgi:hypothetical protein